ncbi:MAG TPA: hypothetical protein VF872_06525 [Gaiellaceae bacterium]
MIDSCTSPGARRRVLELDVVDDLERTDDVGRDELRLVTLVLPVGGTGERDEAVIDLRIDGVRDEAVQHERLEHVAANLGVCALLVVHQLHLQLVVDRGDAEYTLCGLLGLALLAQAPDRAPQGDLPVVGGDCDRGVVHLGIPEELVADVRRQLVVQGHCVLLSFGYRTLEWSGR